MMETFYKTADGKMQFKFQAETMKDVFRVVAEIQKTFEWDRTCGLCGSKDVCFQVRTPSGFTYYELACRNPECKAVLTFGQNMDGGFLWPKVTEVNRGWHRWTPQQQQQQQEQPVPQPRSAQGQPVGTAVTDADVPF